MKISINRLGLGALVLLIDIDAPGEGGQGSLVVAGDEAIKVRTKQYDGSQHIICTV